MDLDYLCEFLMLKYFQDSKEYFSYYMKYTLF